MFDVLSYLVTTLTNEIIEDFVIVKDIINHSLLHRKGNRFLKQQQKFLKQQMKKQKNYDDWRKFAEKYDKLENVTQWKDKVQSKYYNYKYIQLVRDRLREARLKNDLETLIHLVKTNNQRNVGNITNPRLYHQAYIGTKTLIVDFQNELEEALRFISQNQCLSFQMKYDFFNELRQCHGRSALMLSGGGLMGMYHLGVIFSLRAKHLLPKVVSGSSCGALTAAMLCCTKYDDLPNIIDASFINFQSFNQFRVQNVISRNWQRLIRFLEKGFLLQINEVAQFMRDNVGDMTFLEAYEYSGFILNIQVTAMGTHEQSRLLNYITAPHVTIWSAVACSCSVPFIYCPGDLWIKNSKNELILYSEGIKYQDGSFSADLPLETLKEMFNINGFIVSQVNPFVVPWDADRLQYLRHVNKHYLKFKKGLEKIKKVIISEVQHRFGLLKKIGLIPSIFDQVNTIITQNYKGDITIYPNPKFRQYMNILHNPLNPPDLAKYFEHGLKQSFCFIYQIDSYTKIERTIDSYYQEFRKSIRIKLIQKQIQIIQKNSEDEEEEEEEEDNAKSQALAPSLQYTPTSSVFKKAESMTKYNHIFLDDQHDFSVFRDRAISKDVNIKNECQM